MVEAFTPEQAKLAHQANLPDEVTKVVNGFLSLRAERSRIVITQKEVVAALVLAGFDTKTIDDNNMLDFEGSYEASGWKVEYDKPGYNESYEAFWIFVPKFKIQ